MATAEQKAVVLEAPPLTQVFAARLPRPLQPLAGLSVLGAAVAVAAGAIAAPVPVLGALLTLALVIAVWLKPELALGALLLFLPFNVAIFIALANKAGVHTGKLGDWKDVVIVLLFLRGLEARRRRDGELRMPQGLFPRFLIGYVLVYILLTVASPSLQPAVYELSRDVEGPLLFLAVLCLRPSRRVVVGCAFVGLAAALVMGLAAVYEHLGPRAGFIEWYGAPPPPPNSSFLPGNGGWRSGSFLNSPLVLAFYLGVCAPVALGYAIAFRDRTRLALLAGLTSAACVAGILMTETRSGYLGGGIGLALVLIVGVRNRNVRMAVVGAFLIVVTFALVQNQHSSAISRPGENASKQSAWLRDFNLITENPLGFGLGTIDSVGQRFGNTSDTAQSSESTLLAKGVEGGVVALLLYPASLLLLILFMLDQRRRALWRGDEVGAGLAAASVGAAAAVLGCGLFLGIQELVVEVAVWSPAALTMAWLLADPGARRLRPPVEAPTVEAPAVQAVALEFEPALAGPAPALSEPVPALAELAPALPEPALALAELEPALLREVGEPPAPAEPQPQVETEPQPEPRPERSREPVPVAAVVSAAPAWPQVTVVIPAWDTPERTILSLRSLRGLDYEGFDVLVIGPGVGGAELTSALAGETVGEGVEVASPQTAPNLVRGDVLAVLEPGYRPRPGWLRAGVEALGRPRTGTAVGRTVGDGASVRGNRFFRTDVVRYAGVLAQVLDPRAGAPAAQAALEAAGWPSVNAVEAVAEAAPQPNRQPRPQPGHAQRPRPLQPQIQPHRRSAPEHRLPSHPLPAADAPPRTSREAQLVAAMMGIGMARRRPLVAAAVTSAYVWSRRRRHGSRTRPGG